MVVTDVADLATDDLQSPLRRRFSLLFSSNRRASVSSSIKDYRSSCASLTSMGSQGGSPVTLITSPTSSKGSGGKRQKGMAGLIRASRRSTKQSSIIRQNGDIIIVKGGKIVSIRREPCLPRLQDSASSHGHHHPFLHRSLQKNGGAGGRGRREANGHVAEEGEEGAEDTRRDSSKLMLPSTRVSDASSEGSDNVFDDSGSHVLVSADLAAESSLEMISEERRLLSQNSDPDHVETDVDITTDPSREDVIEESAGGDVDSEGAEGGGKLTTDVGIIISIDEDNSILNVMPLTPRTRDRITRSDLFLGEEAGSRGASATDMKTSKSSQGLCKRSIQRLPSVEHLDPPVRLKRASSDYNVHHSSGLAHFLKPAPVSRRWSFGKRPERDPQHV